MGAGGVPGGAGGGGELNTAGGDRVTCLAAAPKRNSLRVSKQ